MSMLLQYFEGQSQAQARPERNLERQEATTVDETARQNPTLLEVNRARHH
jgi:hypothetical protein